MSTAVVSIWSSRGTRRMLATACTAVAVLTAHAYASAPDDTAIRQAAQPIVNWIHPACTAGGLQPPTSPANACNGPWRFDYVETWANLAACGESLRLKVAGTWAPTCAVLNAHIPGPESDFQPIGAPDAETGPEGYWVSLANDSFKSHAISAATDFRRDVGASVTTCYGGSLLTNSSWEACVHANIDYIWSNSETNSHGSDRRSSASFASGIRLPNTPFPVAPAGSLLAVITPAGHPDQVLDVQVVLRDDLIVAPRLANGLGNQVDVSLVVNDLGTCSGRSPSALQIEGARSIPVGNVALAVGAAMSSALAALEAESPAILAQGQLTADEASALRTRAWTLVQQGILPLGLGLAGVPYDLRQLFDSFVETEIASIARRGQMHAIARERVQLQLSADSLAHELAFASDQDRLILLIPRWRLRDLSGVSLAAAIDGLDASTR